MFLFRRDITANVVREDAYDDLFDEVEPIEYAIDLIQESSFGCARRCLLNSIVMTTRRSCQDPRIEPYSNIPGGRAIVHFERQQSIMWFQNRAGLITWLDLPWVEVVAIVSAFPKRKLPQRQPHLVL